MSKKKKNSTACEEGLAECLNKCLNFGACGKNRCNEGHARVTAEKGILNVAKCAVEYLRRTGRSKKDVRMLLDL